MQGFITAAQDAAFQAGLPPKENWLKTKQVEIKTDMVGLVTNVDKAADRLITDTLRSRFPTQKIIAEENLPGPARTARIIGISTHWTEPQILPTPIHTLPFLSPSPMSRRSWWGGPRTASERDLLRQS